MQWNNEIPEITPDGKQVVVVRKTLSLDYKKWCKDNNFACVLLSGSALIGKIVEIDGRKYLEFPDGLCQPISRYAGSSFLETPEITS